MAYLVLYNEEPTCFTDMESVKEHIRDLVEDGVSVDEIELYERIEFEVCTTIEVLL